MSDRSTYLYDYNDTEKKNRAVSPHTDRIIVIFNHLNLKYIIPNNECPRTSTGAVNGYSEAIS